MELVLIITISVVGALYCVYDAVQDNKGRK